MHFLHARGLAGGASGLLVHAVLWSPTSHCDFVYTSYKPQAKALPACHGPVLLSEECQSSALSRPSPWQHSLSVPRSWWLPQQSLPAVVEHEMSPRGSVLM